jgi:hypothetical protein
MLIIETKNTKELACKNQRKTYDKGKLTTIYSFKLIGLKFMSFLLLLFLSC